MTLALIRYDPNRFNIDALLTCFKNKKDLCSYFLNPSEFLEYCLEDEQHLKLIGRVLSIVPPASYHASHSFTRYIMTRGVDLDRLNLSPCLYMYITWMMTS